MKKLLKNRIISAVMSAIMLTTTISAATMLTSVSVIAETATKLAAPTGITKTKTQNSVTLSWKAVSGAMAYRVYMYNASTKKYDVYADTPDTTYTINGLYPATTYKFRLSALAADGDEITEQTKSAVFSVKTKAAAETDNLAAPKVTATVKSTEVTLKWNSISGASFYKVYQYDVSSGNYIKYRDVTSTTCRITDLTGPETYNFAVAAVKRINGKNVPQALSKLVPVYIEAKSDGSTNRNDSTGNNTSEGGSTDNDTSTDKAIKLSCKTNLPAEVGHYLNGAWLHKFIITDFTYEVGEHSTDELYIKIYFMGEVTECNDPDDYYQYINVTLYDSEGYAVETTNAYRPVTTGKFKDMYATFSGLKAGNYTFEISDHGYGDKPKSDNDEEDKLNGCTVDLPYVPQTISYYDYGEELDSTAIITDISCEVDGTDLIIYFSGEKTYDSNGPGQSSQCKIGWKLYEISPEGDIVIEDGVAYTKSLKEGELFKNVSDTAYRCIEPGKHYLIEIMSVNEP